MNCDECGKCCFSEMPKSASENKVFLDEIEDPNKRDEISNKIRLLGHEIKNFYDYSFGYFLKFTRIAGNDKETNGVIIIRTLPKLVDNKWVMACPFFDPKTKKCRIYNTVLYPTICKIYPYSHLVKKIKPLCEPSRIGKISKSELSKIKINYLRITSKESSIGIKEDIDTFKERMREDNYKIVNDLLHNSFGEPTHLENNFKWIFEEVQKEAEFSKKNLK